MKFPEVMKDVTPQLELDRRIDGGQRVDQSNIFLPAYKISSGWIRWTPVIYNHGMIFYGDNDKFYDLMYRFNNSIFGDKYATIHIIDDSNIVGEDDLDKLSQLRVTQVHNGENAVVNAVNEMFDAYEDMNKTCRENGLLDPPNRRYDLIMLILNDDHLKRIMGNPDVFVRLLKMMIHGADFTIPLFLCPKTFSPLWKDFVEASEWCLMLGKENEEKACDFFSEYTVADKDRRYQEQGLFMETGSTTMVPLYSAQNTMSESFSQERNKEKQRQNDYEALLRSLTNGN